MAGNLDGTGMKQTKVTTKEASVEGTAAKDVPGGESSGSSWNEITGPNPGRGYTPTPKTTK
jgi:hypothetical protein